MKKLIIIFFLALIYTATLASQDYWQPTNGPGGGDIKLLKLDYSNGNLWAASSLGRVFLSSDNGNSWVMKNSPVTSNYDLAFKGNTVYLATTTGLFYSEDYGETWGEKVNAPSYNLHAILIVADTLYLGTYGGGIYKSTDDGISWIQINNGLTSNYIGSFVYLIEKGKIFAGSYTDSLFVSDNMGLSWRHASSGLNSARVEDLVDSNTGMYCALNTGVFRSVDDGESWVSADPGAGAIYALAGNGPEIYAGAGNGTLWKSTDGGTNWSSLVADIATPITTIIVSSGIIYTGGRLGINYTADMVIWHKSNEGITGQRISHIMMLGDNIYTTAEFSGIYRSTDNGQAWEEKNNGLPFTYQYVGLATNGTKIYTATSSSQVYESSDQGDNWISIASLSGQFTFMMGREDTLLVGTFSGLIYKSVDGGSSWNQIDNGFISGIVRDIDFFGDYIFVKSDGGFYRTANDGNAWGTLTGISPNGFTTDLNTLFATANDGIYRSYDQGSNWEKINNGLPDDYYFSASALNNRIIVSQWVDNEPQPVFLSENGGDSWENFGALDLAITSIYQQNNTFVAGGYGGPTYISINAQRSQDSLALVAIYNSTTGTGWTDQTNWLTTEPMDNWFGITITDGRVTDIVLVDNNLVGPLPPEIGQLSALAYLIIWNNSISGSLPPEIGQLSNLLWLNLRINSISGTIPPEIGNLNRLISLSLSENDMTGSIPATIGNLLNLERLYLYNNAFDGPIPPEIGNLTKLWRLWLDNNSLSGEIPMEIWTMKNLEELRLRENSLSGQLPMEIGNLDSLRELNLAINEFSGPIPAEIGNLDSLRNLTIDFNNFDGNIPATIGNLTKLEIIYLNGNSFTGAVPVSITNLTNLGTLQIYDNQLVDFPIITSLQNLSVLQMENNLFTFEDIEPNISVPADTFIYAPQDSVGEEQWEGVDEFSPFTMSVSVGGANNEYRWFKDGTAITGADASQYNISAMSAGDAGEYVCRIRNSIATDLTLWSRPVHLTMQGVPAVIDFGMDFNRVTYAGFWARINPHDSECNVYFEYGLDTNYGTMVPSNDNPLNGNVDIDTYVEVTGLSPGTTYHYQLILEYNSVQTGSGDRTFTTGTYPSQITVQTSATFPSYPNPEDYKATDYRIIGLSGNSNLALEDRLVSEPHVDWEAYWDNGNDQNYWVKYDGSNTFRFTQGRAILFVSKNDININETVPSAVIDQFDAVSIDLHNGWNLFCNPFDIPVSWNDIHDENGVDNTLQQPFVFNGTYSQVSVIQPNTGYYLLNNIGLSELLIPYQSSSAKRSKVNEYEWKLDIRLSREDLPADIIKLGISENASPGIDPLDIYKPRLLNGSYGLSFQRSNWDEKYTGFASDIRSDISEINEIFFDVDIKSGEKANLAFSDLDDIPEEYEVYLFDIERAVYLDLREKSSYDFVANKSQQSFKLMIGSETDISAEIEALLPAEFALGKNYPNPFNPETVIPITLPENSHVELSVYDVLGKKVKTLHNGAMAAGRHYIRWNGKDSSGNSLSSGIYFYRLTSSSGKAFTGKMIMMK